MPVAAAILGQRRISPAMAFAFLASACLFVAACGESATPSATPAGAADTPAAEATVEKAPSVITMADKSYDLDDVVAAGWKKSKEFDASTLPHAMSVTYGFHNQRDIEVWVFASHAEALQFGVGPAEQAVAKKPGQTDYLIPRVNRYFAYAVVGNLVMLCERELADCESIIAKLP